MPEYTNPKNFEDSAMPALAKLQYRPSILSWDAKSRYAVGVPADENALVSRS